MNEDLKIPNHVGIILDGNGRWAKMRGKPRTYGHTKGFTNLKKLAKHVFDRGVNVLSVYAFSTENFKRSKEEVDFLMNLFVDKFHELEKISNKNDIKIVFSGIKDKPLPDDVIKVIKDIEEKTKNNKPFVFNICVNYGGNYEIVDATKKIAKEVLDNKLSINDINVDMFSKYLYNDLPPVDFLIRTSGEQRVSNFMLYQIAYSEFYFPDTYFPEFDEKEFDKALLVYNKRDRRFGEIKNN